MFALCDCDSFFASCERIFRPDLYGKPVVVLSNNDGCIVAMTKEAKQLGLHRGDPYFQIKSMCEAKGVAVFSSNYTLYGDISSRVMQILAEEAGDIDIYSIDECFFSVDGFQSETLRSSLLSLRLRIFRGLGIPVSIGVGPTRTLAKVASHYAKKYNGYKGVCIIDSEEKRRKALDKFPVEEVWGIGRRHYKTLASYGFTTAAHFAEGKESWVRHLFGLPGVETWKELRGISCKEVSEQSEKQSICTSRSFGKNVTDIDQLTESVANFASKCALKLRKQHSVCSSVTVFLLTNRFREDIPQYQAVKNLHLPIATSYTPEIVNYTIKALNMIYRPGYQYKKSGVVLQDITDDSAVQQHLFTPTDTKRHRAISETVDRINRQYGSDTVRLAIQNGATTDWKTDCNFRSPDYTTKLNDIIKVKA